MSKPRTNPPLSLRAYARRRGVSAEAVSKAIMAGRLTKSVVRDGRGQPKIADPGLADKEWAASTLSQYVPISVQMDRAGIGNDIDGAPLLAVSRARREAAEARLSELELEEKEGKLVEAEASDRRWTTEISQCRTKLLGIPSRARQQDPSLTVAQLAMLKSLIREALSDLANRAGDDDASGVDAP